MAQLSSHELLELLNHGDAGAGSSEQHGALVDEKRSLNLPAREVAGEAEMASWLCQVFQQEASNPPITATTKSEGETTMRGSSGGSGHFRDAASAGTPADERPRPRSSGRRRSGSGKAAEQRRRDKINDKMRTLQQLMPRCSKTDKVSTLDEVIQYVKLLQHQLQVLSASGYPMPLLPPPGVAPPSCMQRAAGDAPGGPALTPAPVILPPYPFVPAVFTCPYHGNSTPPPQYRYPVGSGSATQNLAHTPNDLAVPSHR
uniref:Uncharacterized protein n=1 Tax=Avena sativa TaxID=4498 RepID=A0ACD5XR62_AVESA